MPKDAIPFTCPGAPSDQPLPSPASASQPPNLTLTSQTTTKPWIPNFRITQQMGYSELLQGSFYDLIRCFLPYRSSNNIKGLHRDVHSCIIY